MNTQQRALLAGIFFGLLTPLVSSAEPLSRSNYEDELRRCVNEIRAELNVAGELRHYVRDVSRDRLWYEFEIETHGAAGDTVAGPEAAVLCRAYRYEDRVRMQALGNPQTRDSASRVAQAR